MRLFLENYFCYIGMAVFFTALVLFMIRTWIKYRLLIRETENMSVTQNKSLKKIKNRFYSRFSEKNNKDKMGINVELFVDKTVEKMKLCGFTPRNCRFICGQLLIFSIVFAGLGALRGIADGAGFGEILPFYLLSALEIYLYFSLSGLLDLEGKAELIKLNIRDYLEQHYILRLETARNFQMEEEMLELMKKEEEKEKAADKEDTDELELLLEEFI